eukprot:scaffold4241_cov145-Isochrysis_galbana.AAC.3
MGALSSARRGEGATAARALSEAHRLKQLVVFASASAATHPSWTQHLSPVSAWRTDRPPATGGHERWGGGGGAAAAGAAWGDNSAGSAVAAGPRQRVWHGSFRTGASLAFRFAGFECALHHKLLSHAHGGGLTGEQLKGGKAREGRSCVSCAKVRPAGVDGALRSMLSGVPASGSQMRWHTMRAIGAVCGRGGLRVESGSPRCGAGGRDLPG